MHHFQLRKVNLWLGAVHEWRHGFRGEGVSRILYLSLITKKCVKNYQKLHDVIYRRPIRLLANGVIFAYPFEKVNGKPLFLQALNVNELNMLKSIVSLLILLERGEWRKKHFFKLSLKRILQLITELRITRFFKSIVYDLQKFKSMK